MIKKFLLAAYLIFTLSDLFGQSKFEDLPWIGFNWQSGEINGRYFDKLAITIPLKIDNIPQSFEAQFDLGADLTMLYENSMKPYFEKYSNLRDKKTDEEGFQWIENVKVILDGIVFDNRKILIRKNYGKVLTSDSIENNKIRQVGTIGADFFQDKILVLDYKNKRLCVIDSLNQFIEKEVRFISYRADEQGRVIIPFDINGKEYDVLFDTGASIFGFISTKKIWETICDTTIVTKLDSIRSWGEYLEFWDSPIKGSLTIKGTGIEIDNARLFFPNPTPENLEFFFSNSRINGLTGNTFFLKKCLFIDFKNKKFGILK
ncbi:MAG: hypothetical protein LBT27_01815 [Prevotellaceae bacterium]|jgi:hypothetical protein|nr:hypothetical protein [Prevotellaceae bacterium]